MAESTKPWTECAVCGAGFQARRPKQKTCSNRCYMFHQRNPSHRDTERTCAMCQNVLPSGVHRAARYCSRGCRSAASKRRLRPIAAEYIRSSACQHCGAAIVGQVGKRFCSDRCWSRDRFGRSHKDLSARRCEHCGAPVPIGGRADKRHCSNRCTVLANQAIRRARRARLPVERFSRNEIFERDGWTCHICKEPVDPSIERPDMRSASLDHLIPFSDPGSPGHVRTNVALAHLYCNFAKNGRTRPEDWMLHHALAAAAILTA